MKEIQQVLDTLDSGEAHEWARRFFDAAGKLDAGQDEERIHLTALGGACIPMLTLASNDGPYGNVEIIPSDQPIVAVGQFHREQMEALMAYTSDEFHAELRARCADLVWTALRADYKLAGIASDAYLEVAKERETGASWTVPFKRIERAWRLARAVRDSDRMDAIKAYIDEVLDRLDGKDYKFFTTNLHELMLEIGPGNPSEYALRARKAAEYAATQEHHRKARGLWEIAAKWHRRAREPDEEREATLKAARTYVAEAEASGSQMVKAAFLGDAVTALKRATADSNEIKQVQKALISANRRSAGEMAGIGVEIPIGGMIAHAEKTVDVDHPHEALLRLVASPGIPTVNELNQVAQSRLKETTFMHLMSATVVNREGKQVGTVPAAESGDLANNETVIKHVMAREMAQSTALTAQGWIWPAFSAIARRFPLTRTYWRSVFANSALVPPDRVGVWAKAYFYLANDDIETALHIIVPQLEQAIRFRLETAGAVVTRHTDEGGQDELLLGDLLWLPEFELTFGEDYAFLLRQYLHEKTSLNLRNQISHGLASSNALSGANALYLAWLALRLALDPTLATTDAEPDLPAEPKEPHIIKHPDEEE